MGFFSRRTLEQMGMPKGQEEELRELLASQLERGGMPRDEIDALRALDRWADGGASQIRA